MREKRNTVYAIGQTLSETVGNGDTHTRVHGYIHKKLKALHLSHFTFLHFEPVAFYDTKIEWPELPAHDQNVPVNFREKCVSEFGFLGKIDFYGTKIELRGISRFRTLTVGIGSFRTLTVGNCQFQETDGWKLAVETRFRFRGVIFAPIGRKSVSLYRKTCMCRHAYLWRFDYTSTLEKV
jgi:hypothetical protein